MKLERNKLMALFAAGLLLLGSGCTRPANDRSSDKAVHAYTYEQFAVSEKFEGTPAAVDFSSKPEAKLFYTRITEGAKQKPNFAGHYTVVEWGCGTSCQNHAIVDAQTGKIVEYGLASSYGAGYRPESRLFIINPQENLADLSYVEPSVRTEYYVMENGRLTLLDDAS